MAYVHPLAAEAAIVGTKLGTKLGGKLRKRGTGRRGRRTGGDGGLGRTRGRAAAVGSGRSAGGSGGGTQLHGVITAEVTGSMGTWRWRWNVSVAHHNIITAIGKITHILPVHARSPTDQELTDLGLEAVDEVEAEISGMSIRDVGDEALEFIGIGFDGGSLAEVEKCLACLVIRVRVAQVTG